MFTPVADANNAEASLTYNPSGFAELSGIQMVRVLVRHTYGSQM